MKLLAWNCNDSLLVTDRKVDAQEEATSVDDDDDGDDDDDDNE